MSDDAAPEGDAPDEHDDRNSGDDSGGAAYVTVARVGEIADGEGRTVTVGERLVALFARGGRYYAIDDLCPHQGASLGAGWVDDEGAVACPWHAWRFSINDGRWCDNPRLAVATYPTRVVGQEVQVGRTPLPAQPDA